MAEPVSLTASLITIIQIATSCIRWTSRAVQSYHNAPSEFLALSNEINDSHLVLVEILRTLQNISRSNQADADRQAEALRMQMDRAYPLLIDIQSLIMHTSTYTTSNSRKVQILGWFRQRSKMKHLQEELRTIREKLQMLLTLYNALADSFASGSLFVF